MNILLIGSNGFLGRRILAHLSKVGYDVQTLDRTDENPLGFFNGELVQRLLSDSRFDVVISTAWVTSHHDYRVSDENQVFCERTISLFQTCASARIGHFIGFGSAAEYGDFNLNCMAGYSQTSPTDHYGLAKLKTFSEISGLRLTSPTKFSWLRVFQPFGPGQSPTRFFPTIIKAIKSGSPLKLQNPAAVSDWISSHEVARAIDFVIKHELEGAIDVGMANSTSNLQLVELLERKLQRKASIDTSSVSRKIQGLVVSPKSIIFEEGWSPEMNLEDSISRHLMEIA